MFKDLHWLIILLLFALFFYYSNKNNNQYLISEGFKNSKVYLGDSPIKTNDILNLNDMKFTSSSVYEVGKIDYPYNNYYQGYYSSYI